jgi:hypothetical protein
VTARKTTPAHESWDEFWAEVSPGRAEVIRGVEVQVPSDMPLAVERRIQELRESSAEEDIAELLQMLFGVDVLNRWRENGMGLQELQTVLTWGIAQASGTGMSFAEAYELVLAGDGEGKPLGPKGPNRAARRAPSKSTGGQSKRTSSASTGSARTRSRS